jgi:hypothetical protein
MDTRPTTSERRQRSKTKCATMSKVKCATVLKAKEVRNDAEGKRAEIPNAKCGKVKRAGRARDHCPPKWRRAADVRALLCVSLLHFCFFVHPQRNVFFRCFVHRHIYGPPPHLRATATTGAGRDSTRTAARATASTGAKSTSARSAERSHCEHGLRDVREPLLLSRERACDRA